jgi:hypothetical protein
MSISRQDEVSNPLPRLRAIYNRSQWNFQITAQDVVRYPLTQSSKQALQHW